jgi:hypothetical protein
VNDPVASSSPKSRWGAGEWLGFAGIIIGVIVSAFFYWVSEKSRDLTFVLSPSRPEIVRAGVVSDIKAYYKGTEITGNLSIITIAVWNQGREPIRYAEDVLRPITVRPGADMKILEVKIVKSTREEIGFQVVPTTPDGGFNISWRILERGDGALLQLLAVNAPAAPILPVAIAGSVVGQGAIGDSAVKESVSETAVARFGKWEKWEYAGAAFALFALFMYCGLTARELRKLGWSKFVRKEGIATIFHVALISATVWGLWRSTPSSPFGI